MEGKPPGEDFGPGSPGYGPGGPPPDHEESEGPQTPAPDPAGPQSPAPGPPSPPSPGPQSPAPGAPPPAEPESPAPGAPPTSPPAGPQSPSPGYAPPERASGYPPPAPPPGYAPPGPESPGAPTYGGPVPPGGWQQPMASPASQPRGQLASWGSRAGAYLIDGLVLLVPGVILWVLIVGSAVGLSGGDDDVALGAAIGLSILWLLAFGVIALLYAPVLMMREGARNGQTWGKQAVDIRAVRDNGQPFTFGSAALRDVVLKNIAVGIASTIIPVIPWFLNFFWPLWDDENRALHDMAASTHVVKA
jgi:uncharacterized RDD family membrane protein YckC